MAVSELNSLSGLSDKEAEAAERKYGANAVAFKGSLRSSFAESFSSLSVRLLIISVLSDVVLLLLGMLGFAPLQPPAAGTAPPPRASTNPA